MNIEVADLIKTEGEFEQRVADEQSRLVDWMNNQVEAVRKDMYEASKQGKLERDVNDLKKQIDEMERVRRSQVSMPAPTFGEGQHSGANTAFSS